MVTEDLVRDVLGLDHEVYFRALEESPLFDELIERLLPESIRLETRYELLLADLTL
jgi:hypothetical protein